ncbi:ribosome biogenesis protein SPATA5 [Condylostylus longicornis]|uniref:ribosome biogenesis protein SPATA5 n=1 Tax=Condylostylus longicornis TaxID=2530218 RepID=UPI00244DE434|nr:ribosome biogenesis protein SPATA5 [Condylostylus longicornis]
MSRKSLPKRNQQSLWLKCENCCCLFGSKYCENHKQFCNSDATLLEQPFAFIKNEKLISNSCKSLESAKIVIEEIKDLQDKQKNSLVFISEEVMRLCQMKTGENVACYPLPEKSPYLIRMVWPIQDKHLGQVFFSEEDFSLNWENNENCKLQIEKLCDDPIPVKEITLKYIKSSSEHQLDFKKLSKMLQFHMWNRIYTIGNIIHYKFYNKLIKLEIINYQPILNEDVQCTFALDNVFKNLNIGKQIYLLCTKKTDITILENESEDVETNNFNKSVQIEDIGGHDDVIENLKDIVLIGLGMRSIPSDLKISRGALLHGPSGCGKSMLAEAFANYFSTFDVQIIKIKSNEIFSKFFGETELNLQNKFEKAFSYYPKPSLIILEDINNLCPKYENNEIIKRVLIAFLNLFDSLHLNPRGKKVFVLATTNNLENLHPGIRRCGRFDNEIEIQVPNPETRYEILKKHLGKVDHKLNELQIQNIANITHGFVGSDLVNLVYKAAINSLNRQNEDKYISSDDINSILNLVKPSAMRQVLIECPNVKWDDIGGQHDLKLKLRQSIEWPLLYPDKFTKLGIKPPRGILMFGPPGCSKTMIAKALATESRLNFLSIKGPELFSMWVGESERAVREVFRKAKQVAPSIIFFDEIDAISGERSSDGQPSSVKERVLTQLLTELDGVDTLKDVTIVAATNRPDMIDKALLRPGRIDRLVYVGLPDDKTREEIFKIKLKIMPLHEDVILEELINKTNGYSGAEIQALCHEAALKTLEENLEAERVCWKHFEIAFNLVRPRTSKKLLDLYEQYISEKL